MIVFDRTIITKLKYTKSRFKARMELVPQDILNGIIVHLNRNSMINLSCTNSTINRFFDSETLWRELVKRHYPKCEHIQTCSYYETYVQEYVNRNVRMYVGVTYWTETDDEKQISPRFWTCDEAFEWLWNGFFLSAGIFKQYYQLKPQLRRLKSTFAHNQIRWICRSKNPKLSFRSLELAEEFLYDEDLSEQDCLDLMDDYMDHVDHYKEILRKEFKLEGSRSEITRKTGDCGWNIYRIEKVKGIREYSDDETGDNGETLTHYQKWCKLNTKAPYDFKSMVEAIKLDKADSTQQIPTSDVV